MKEKKNLFTDLLIGRIKKLMLDSEILNGVKHPSIKGYDKEDIVFKFLESFLPVGLKIHSGFVVDAFGNQSLQTDMIIYNPELLPSMIHNDKFAIIPVEASLRLIEIKSTLRKKDLEQIERQNKAVECLKPCKFANNPDYKEDNNIPKSFLLPTTMMAFNTDLKSEDIVNWMKENGNTSDICIIGKMHFVHEDLHQIKQLNDNQGYNATRYFLYGIYNGSEYLKRRRNLFNPDISVYYLNSEFLDHIGNSEE